MNLREADNALRDRLRPLLSSDRRRRLRAVPSEPAVEPERVDHPPHYNQHPSGIECIDIVEHMTFCAGNAVKYIWRAGLKSADPVEDMRKAAWYAAREAARLEKARALK